MSISKKVILIGHFGVGKTSLVRRFVDSAFSEEYIVTLGVQVKKKQIKLDEKEINLIIWDLEGNTSVEKARESYLMGTHGFLYVFDITRPETYQDFKDQATLLKQRFLGVPLKVIGNKADLIDSQEMEQFFSSQMFEDCHFTSAKTGNNVSQIFKELTQEMIAQ